MDSETVSAEGEDVVYVVWGSMPGAMDEDDDGEGGGGGHFEKR